MNKSELETMGTGRAKLIILGEHAAVYGHAAVGTPLPETLTLEYKSTKDPLYQSFPLEFQEKIRLTLEGLQRIVSRSNLNSLLDSRFGKITIRSDVPLAGGYGSSAALSVALVRLFLPELSDELVWQYAHELECNFHAKPSGIDTALAHANHALGFLPKDYHDPRLPEYIKLDTLGITLVHGAVPRMGNTGSLVTSLKSRLMTDSFGEGPWWPLIAQLGTLAHGLITSPKPINASDLGFMVTEAHEILGTLGLGNSIQDEILDFAQGLGALGGKMSGAGGGGSWFCVAKDELHGHHMARLIKDWADQNKIPLVFGPRVVSI